MGKTEIISGLQNLSENELTDVQAALDKLRGPRWLDPTLTDDDKHSLQEGLDDHERNPSEGESWDAVKARISAELNR